MDEQVTQDFLQHILGDFTLGSWLAYFAFALIGVMIYSYNDVKNRSVPSKRSPIKFSWLFFLKDNVKKFIMTMLLIYIQFRFYEQLSGSPMNDYAAFLMGFTADGLSGMSKKQTEKLVGKRKEIYGEVKKIN